MSEEVKNIRLSKAAREFNVGTSTIVEFLAKKGMSIDPSPNTKLTEEQYALVVKEYQGEKEVKKNADQLGNIAFKGKTITVESTEKPKVVEEEEEIVSIKSNILVNDKKDKGEKKDKEDKEEKIEIKENKEEKVEVKKEEKQEEKVEAIKLNVVGKIDLDGGKKAKEQKGDGQPGNTGKKEEKPQPKPAQPAKPVEAPKPAQPKPQPKPVQPQPQKPAEPEQQPAKPELSAEDNFIPTKFTKLEGPRIVDKIELPVEHKGKGKPVATSGEDKKDKKKKRKRIGNSPVNPNEVAGADKPKDKGGKPQQGGKQQGQGGKPGKDEKRSKDRFKKGKQPIFEEKPELSDEEIQKQIKETLARLSPLGKSKTSKHRREKRHNIQNELEEERMHEMEEQKILKVTEFVTANELATLMNIPVTKVIATCMSLGMFVSINQRLDAEILQVVAEEFGFKVEFQSMDVQEAIAEADEPDNPEDLVPRAPVVTVMGHVDHGKTKLLDFIRSTNVVAGEAGGITQHIGAYEVKTSTGKKITFLDTPGHEAFTAMRARGAKITDVAIIVIAADDNVMPQTVEAINHAHAANVPIVFAINKIDKPTADPQKIYRQLADMNILVEEWGGKVQSQEISAKQGIGVDELLEKVLLEAEMLDLKGNPNKLAKGAVIESALDKGRGYVAKLLVQEGTLHVGDMVLAGTTYG
ncbi:MAG: translation initiation factor IF-2, partial [Bacteroidetes bacterium]|nr:translation initiation factor IF-2 [Bacteroidota bacterium]